MLVQINIGHSCSYYWCRQFSNNNKSAIVEKILIRWHVKKHRGIRNNNNKAIDKTTWTPTRYIDSLCTTWSIDTSTFSKRRGGRWNEGEPMCFDSQHKRGTGTLVMISTRCWTCCPESQLMRGTQVPQQSAQEGIPYLTSHHYTKVAIYLDSQHTRGSCTFVSTRCWTRMARQSDHERGRRCLSNRQTTGGHTLRVIITGR
jgi:hypothetical protein